jgi:histidinol-phosphate aminotransferase
MIHTHPQPRAGVLDITAYTAGRSQVPGLKKVYKLSSNETPLGPSPKAIDAFHETAKILEYYPDGGSSQLRVTIGQYYSIDADRIVCGAGSDELLSLVTQAYLGPGDEAIYTRYGFSAFDVVIRANGGFPIVAAEVDLHADVDSILACLSPRTKIIFLANPNNPTGTYLPFDEVKRLHAGLPAHVILVLDAAYADYVPAHDYADGLELALNTPNVVMTRTFSKAYGLAGLRLGWLAGPDSVVEAVNRIRGPFNVSAPAIAAGVAAIQDTKHLETAVAHNAYWRPKVMESLSAIGLQVTPSVSNFVLAHFPETQGRSAGEADRFLSGHGLILRKVAGYGLLHSLRMTIGSAEANRLVVEALTKFMGAS